MTKSEPSPGKTDWARIRAMTDEERLAGALADPDAQPLSDAMLARARRANGVKMIRARLNMTQAQFCTAYHLPLSTLRDWEQARSRPDAPARALLTAIYNDPETMIRLVNGHESPTEVTATKIKLEREAAHRLARMGGTMPNLKAAPRRRPFSA